jgi:hypothetical protein
MGAVCLVLRNLNLNVKTCSHKYSLMLPNNTLLKIMHYRDFNSFSELR